MLEIAVLTGDLIASTKAGPEAVERAVQALSEAAGQLSGWVGHDTRFTRFRGDGWQLFLARPGLALRATLFLLANLRATDTGISTRLSIAIGPYDRLGEAGLASASGAAFVMSGRLLDTMHKTRRIGLSENADDVFLKAAIIELAEWQASRWSREQAKTVALALSTEAPTQAVIAAQLGITRQAVQARLKGAGVSAFQTALHAFEMPQDDAA